MIIKPVPESLEAEQSTLGAQMIDPSVIMRAHEFVKPEDYYKPLHVTIQQAILTIDARGERVEVFDVVEELRRTNKLNDGDAAYMLACVEACESSAKVETYAKIVQEKAILRRLMNVGREIETLAFESESPEVAIEAAEQKFLDLSKGKVADSASTLLDLVDAECKQMAWLSANPGQKVGVQTGFKDLDGMTGGLQPQNLIILAARPSMGKTALALQMAYNVASIEKKPAVVFSLEMSKEQLTQRLISGHAKVNSRHMREATLNDEEWERVENARLELRRQPVHVIDTAQITTMAMRSHCRRIAQRHGALGAVMVDYIQLAQVAQKYGNRVELMSIIGKDLKSLAKEMNCPVIALSQLSRAVEQREDKRPQLSDSRDSGTIEEDADLMLFVYREAYYKNKSTDEKWGPNDVDDGLAEIIIAKHRNGPTGTVKLAFLPEFARFENLARGYEH